MKWYQYIFGWLQVTILVLLLPIFAIFTLLIFCWHFLLSLFRRTPRPRPSDYVLKFRHRIIHDLIYSHIYALRGQAEAPDYRGYFRRHNKRDLFRRHKKSEGPVIPADPPLFIPFSHNTPFTPDGHQVIFLDLSPDQQVTHFVEDNYEAICRHYKKYDLQFVYLPRYVETLNYRTLLTYNRPDLNKAQIDYLLSQTVDSRSIQQLFVSSAITKLPNAPLLIRYKKKLTEDEQERAGKNGTTPQLIFSVFSFRGRKEHALRKQLRIYPQTVGEEPNRTFYSLKRLPEEDRADCSLDFQTISQEIRDRIDQLRQMGIDEAILYSLFQKPVTLSHLRISRDFRIFLTDYGNREIKLPPLAKSLYFLFLRYPEGLLFKELVDHRLELLELYKNISNRENLDKMEASIDDLINPTKNSINEKCSRIKEVFLCEFDDSVACNYYIVGQQMMPKHISLDRTLLIDESNMIYPYQSK